MAKEEKTEIVKAQSTEITQDMPDFIEAGLSGLEHVTEQDLQMPRLALAQLTSPELDEENENKFIEGLKFGNMFNNLTKQVYGNGPLKFSVLRADPPRWVEFIPLEAGGGVKDPNVSWDDPRTQFGPGGEPPVATKFYDFILMIYPEGAKPEPITVSFKSTGLKTARQLNSLIQLRNKPLYAGIYKLTTSTTKNAKGRYSIFNVDNAGWPATQEQYQTLKELSEQLRNVKVVFDQEQHDAAIDPDAPDAEKE